jgi:uncharacterized membrane protein
MTFTCFCETQKDGTKGVSSENCEKCNEACSQIQATYNGACVNTGLLFGVSMTIVIAIVVISIIVFILTIWFSIHVMNKCKGKPTWLNPTIITLLVLWILIGWFPPIGLLLFIILLVILIIYNNKCKKR